MLTREAAQSCDEETVANRLMEVSPVLGEDAEFNSGNPYRFAARYVAHDGEIQSETADKLFSAFGKLPIRI